MSTKRIFVLIVIILLISGCIGENHKVRSNSKVVNKTIMSNDDFIWWNNNPVFAYYPLYPYAYYDYGESNTVSKVYVVQRPSTEEGWDIKAPEIVKVTESDTEGKVSVQEEEIYQSPDESLQQAVDEASSSNAVNVGDVPGDESGSSLSLSDSSLSESSSSSDASGGDAGGGDGGGDGGGGGGGD